MHVNMKDETVIPRKDSHTVARDGFGLIHDTYFDLT